MNLNRLYAAALCLILASTAGCGSGEPDNALDELSPSERQQFDLIISDLEARAGFDIVVPQFVPIALDPIPEAELGSIPLEGVVQPAFLTFYPRVYPRAGLTSTDIPSEIELLESPLQGRSPPLCDEFIDVSCELIWLGDYQAPAVSLRSTQGYVAYDVYIVVGEIDVRVGAHWEYAGATPTSAMKRMVNRVAESMLPEE